MGRPMQLARWFVFATAVAATVTFIACGTQTGTGEQALPASTATISREYQLPAAFNGCWEGTIEGFDSVTPLSFAGRFVSEGLRTTYQLCYRPHEGGGGELTLTKLEIEGHKATVTRFDNRVTKVDLENQTGHLRNHVVLESVAYVFWLFPVTAHQEIFADEDIKVISPDALSMRGSERIRVGDQDIAEVTFHGDFHRVPG
jgi:hypothetical protein